MRYASKFYADDTHSSAPLITEFDGLRFIFGFYRLKLTESDFETNSTALPEKIKKHFANVSRQMGYTIMPPEEMINSMGYQALQRKHLVAAEAFFKQNTVNYPQSWNVYDSYGDYFLAKKDKAAAIAQFEKALSLENNAETREKLEALRK
ncbi:hypothetical protein [Dyadobacter aurulentus]|uniref:hypothetical protein n=1 Tax=Dyadobacter sp. UC 10 TaxID=2605428 RepID=UPI0011F19E84|nr:hypothetical protein [Dyadobacter sp. UC 10]KAA0992959.1 hypothetical protein FXO21_23715 [Dyadobacter sp. UC 10]